MKYFGLFLAALLLGLSACSPKLETATVHPQAVDTRPVGSAYPAAGGIGTQAPAYIEPSAIANTGPAYPMPTVDYTNTTPSPTADSADGLVKAVIFNNGQPVPYVVFFLADVMKDPKTGMELGTSLDRNVAPKSVSDKDGKIEFVNVKPGRYGLVLLDGTTTYLLLNPADGQAILLSVNAGETVDLKQLNFNNLPIN